MAVGWGGIVVSCDIWGSGEVSASTRVWPYVEGQEAGQLLEVQMYSQAVPVGTEPWVPGMHFLQAHSPGWSQSPSASASGLSPANAGRSLLDLVGKPSFCVLWGGWQDIRDGAGTRKPLQCVSWLLALEMRPAALPYSGHTPASSDPSRLTRKRISVHTLLVTGVWLGSLQP